MILVTGAKGQIGSDLTHALREHYGTHSVLETDIHPTQPGGSATDSICYEVLDVTDRNRLEDLVIKYDVDTIFHLASLLSARGEENPLACWRVNIDGLRNVLEVSAAHDIKVFWPSSIAVFGPTTPRVHTPQATVLQPTTMYGVTKVSGELLCQYYANRFNVDVRSLRLPGIISFTTEAGGGTTDYAVDIFREALASGRYTCFVGPDTILPMMYMPDTIRAILELMDADADRISIRTAYNISGSSFSARELAEAIKKQIPAFECNYAPDFRQSIADTWPESVDDTKAREDWGWQPNYSLPAIVKDMLANLRLSHYV